ncbi:MAG TPA: cyclic nucleotide-binding protein [Planktothrix sp. UBA10369]|jgi:cAMP-binding proteins - catabolite gene activator and regulatory subunit of cAMP-dependent protein kinases|nr:cyclic nucleotide-binding protein [Planktothrix sp. UBA8402]HBK22176.1 cyclic nucleotide-binding protein [Planktothrix sp. UBA10369]
MRSFLRRIPPLHPESKSLTVWEALLVFVTLYNCFIIPFRMAFNATLSKHWLLLDCLADFILISDIFLRFHVGYIDEGEVVKDKQKISYYYRNTDFKSNLLSSLPINILVYLFFPNTSLFLIGLCRIPRLLRFPQCLLIFRKWDNNVYFNSAVIRMFELLIIVFLIDHWIACLWFFIGNITGQSGESWLQINDLYLENTTTQYLHSLYWSITTLTTVGYGDITPQNNIELIFTFIVMFLGVSLYAFIIGNVAAIISNLDASKNRFRDKLGQIQSYMWERKIPRSLQKNVLDYYQYMWEYNRDISIDFDLLDELPHSIKTQMYCYLYQELLEKVPLFQNAEPCFIEDLIIKLKPRILPPNDYVIREEQIGHEMYFVKRGQLQAFSEKTGKVYTVMAAGSFFGEIALIYDSRRTASVKTLTYCELFVLYKEDFNKVLENYPQFSKKVKEIAEERYQSRD